MKKQRKKRPVGRPPVASTPITLMILDKDLTA
jgi:hypothetical protein